MAQLVKYTLYLRPITPVLFPCLVMLVAVATNIISYTDKKGVMMGVLTKLKVVCSWRNAKAYII